MIDGARFAHTNIVAHDWRALAKFYVDVFGCVPVPPERDYRGDAVDRVTGIVGAHVEGLHLRLPGLGPDGPTLEIFEYSPAADRPPDEINRPGFAHIAFVVASVENGLREAVAHGGRPLGETVTQSIATGAEVTLVYLHDPEGNIVELQSWEPPPDS